MTGGIIRRLFVASAAALVSIAIVLIVVTIADLYLVGHGLQPINREMLAWPGVGVSLSLADILLLLIGLSTWFITWCLVRRTSTRNANLRTGERA